MRCPICANNDDKVIETRTTNDNTVLRRRRQCLSCGHRFTTYERIEDKPVTVIKKNGSLQAFDRTKISRAIRVCTDKLNIDTKTIDNLVSEVEEEIIQLAGTKMQISSSQIGEEILKKLYQLNTVAYVRFASVYRSFNNLEQFIKEIERLSQEKSRPDVKPFTGK